MGKFIKISQTYFEGNKHEPYKPKPVALPAIADIPNIRPNPIKSPKPLTTDSDSSLDAEPKQIKLSQLFKKAQVSKNQSIVDDTFKKSLVQSYLDKNMAPDSLLASYGIDKDFYVGLGGTDTSFWDKEEEKSNTQQTTSQNNTKNETKSRDLYDYYKEKNWDPTKESWWDPDKGASYGWVGGKSGWKKAPTPDDKIIEENNNTSVSDSLNTSQGQGNFINITPTDTTSVDTSGSPPYIGPNASQLDKWYGDDYVKVKVDSIRNVFGKKPRLWPYDNNPADTLGTSLRQVLETKHGPKNGKK